MIRLVLLGFCYVVLGNAQKGPCFEFDGNSHLEFEPDGFDLSHSAHYLLTFKTTSPNGILLYTQGSHDYEVLFLRDGILYYQLVNPEETGVGGTYGTRLKSDQKVNNDTLLTVELFRNRRVRRGETLMPGQTAEIKTGMVVKDVILGTEEEHLARRGVMERVQIMGTLYIGGARRELSDTVKYFTGQISNIKEKKNGVTFVDPSRNQGVTRCLISGRQPN